MMCKGNFSIYQVFLLILAEGLVVSAPLDFDSSHQIFHFHGTDTESNIGRYLKSLGDINNDGFDDIAFTSKSPAGSYIFHGGNPVDSFPDYFLKGNYFIGDFIDYSGDGIPDIVTGSASDTDGVIYLYPGSNDSISDQPIDSITMPENLRGYRLKASGDINDDSIGDLLVNSRNPYEGDLVLLYLDPFTTDKMPDWSYWIEDYTHTLPSGGFFDFNGDSISDIFISLQARLDTLSYVYIFLGPSFKSEPDVVLGHPIELDTLYVEYFGMEINNIGDVNADGWEDLGIIFDFAPLVYLCGPNADTIYDYYLVGRCEHMAGLGDVNDDGYNDLVIGGSDSWYGRVILFLGEPEFDIYRDDQITDSDLPPLFLDEIGWRVSPAGDLNNDGYDDILFSCQNFAYGEPWDVFVFSGGSDITVDVADVPEQVLPNDFVLYQNYPNPFNAGTGIEYSLVRKSWVNISIYNVLGQKIKMLVDERKSAGDYKVTWDGTDDAGKEVGSGVYFYRIKAGEYREVRKMVVVR